MKINNNLKVGQIIGGEFSKLLIRQKSSTPIELGDLLIVKDDKTNIKFLVEIYDIAYASQLSQQTLELISGMMLEENEEANLYDHNLRLYNLAIGRVILTMLPKKVIQPKTMPSLLSFARHISKEDVVFLTKPSSPLFVGNLRSGSKVLDFPVYINAYDSLTHHILIAASTGKGKSNLCKVLLWDILSSLEKNKLNVSVFVIDAHDEYYGRTKLGLKDHRIAKERIVYYTPNVTRIGNPNVRNLYINVKDIKPNHIFSVLDLSDPQKEAITLLHRNYQGEWIHKLLSDTEDISKLVGDLKIRKETLLVVQRKIMALLNISTNNGRIVCNSLFSFDKGYTTIEDIVKELENSKVVIIDSSSLPNNIEILIANMIISKLFSRYKYYKRTGELVNKPIVSVILEEAPRVIGKEALSKSSNIFGTIAREGRKFKIGLIAITQLCSLIPKEILANMNTKIILGINMKAEREAIINNSSQDISYEDRNIASLDKGEAIITSAFTKFAIPVKIPLFEDFVKVNENNISENNKNNANNKGIKIDTSFLE